MKVAYLALLGSALCGLSYGAPGDVSGTCDYNAWTSLAADMRTLRIAKSPFEATYIKGHCLSLQSFFTAKATNQTLPFDTMTALSRNAVLCGEETYQDVYAKSVDGFGSDVENSKLCSGLFPANSGLGSVFLEGGIAEICGYSILWQVGQLCSVPPECPGELDRAKLTTLNDCTLDVQFALGSAEREEYVNSGADKLCVQNSATKTCDEDEPSNSRVFDDCKISTGFIVASLKSGDDEADADACVNGFAPKSERCANSIGDVIQEMCTVATTAPTAAKVEEEASMIPIFAGAGAGGLIIIGVIVYFACVRGKSNDSSAVPYGNGSSYNNGSNNKMAMANGSSFTAPPMVGAYPSSSAGMSGGMMPQSANFGNVPGASPYGSGMPGNSPYGSVSVGGGGGHRAPGASGGAMVPSGKYLGVMRNNATGVWVAEFRDNGVNEYLGQFDTEDEAARAYDIRALQVKGSAVELNFPFGSAGPSGGLGLAGLKVGGMPPPMPGRGMGSTAGSVSGGSVAGGPSTASLKEQLTQFYNFHDPGRPNISGHVDRLFEKYRFVNIARAVKAKYQRLPPGWEEELARRGESADPSGSASTLTRPPGL